MTESIPDRAARIARDHNVSPREARRVAFSESRLERRRDDLLLERRLLVDPEKPQRARRRLWRGDGPGIWFGFVIVGVVAAMSVLVVVGVVLGVIL